MDTVKTIKGVKEEDWEVFRKLAKRHDMNMGRFFGMLVRNYPPPMTLAKLVSFPKLSDKDAEDMLKRARAMRKDWV